MELLIRLVIFIFSVIGLADIIVDSDMPLVVLFRKCAKWFLSFIPGGNWAKIVECNKCCGTWCGFLCGGVLLDSTWYYIPFYGFAGYFLAGWGVLYIEYLQTKTLISLGDNNV